MGVHASPLTWLTRVLWFTLPLTLGDLIAAGLDGRSDAVRVAGTAMWWTVWFVGLLAAMVLSIRTLVLLRVLAPVPLLAAIVAATDGAPSALGWVGLATAAVVAVTAMAAEVGLDFVNAASYGDERRFPLRPPAALLLGPVQLVWAVAVVPLPVGVLLAADQRWAVGLPLIAVGVAGAWWAAVTLSRLALRWVVVVPAGLTIVDPMTLMDPVLLRREAVRSLEPAVAGTTAHDLTGGAPGLVLEIDLSEPVTITPTVGRHQVASELDVTEVLITPTRPGELIRHAAGRDIATAPA